MTQEEINKALMEANYQMNGGCGPQMMIYTIIMFVFFLFASCSTKQSVESTTDIRHLTELTSRVDSLIHSTSTWQQSIFKQQTSLVDSFKSREVRDTSRSVFLGAAGDTIKEQVIIKEIIEREHNTSQESETWVQEIFKQTDSLLCSNTLLQSKVDSLLHIHDKETVVEKEAPWYERWMLKLAPWVIVGLLLYIVSIHIKKKGSS